jgi:hypothetical protein
VGAFLDPRRRHLHAVEEHGSVAGIGGPLEAQEVHGGGADEVRDEERRRMVVDVLGRAELLDHSVVHHHDLVAHLHGFELVVGDVDRGGAHAVVEGP